MITDPVDGLLIKPREPEVFAAAIRRLCADDDERIRLKSAALDTVRTKFSPARAAEKLKDWYGRILQRILLADPIDVLVAVIGETGCPKIVAETLGKSRFRTAKVVRRCLRCLVFTCSDG